jgi:pimeloyl-ACP methyl ester carboxylesterase
MRSIDKNARAFASAVHVNRHGRLMRENPWSSGWSTDRFTLYASPQSGRILVEFFRKRAYSPKEHWKMICRIGDIPVYYEVFGTGRPILMIHGFSPDHRLMSGCMEPIFEKRAGWRRIYFDLPGMGRTPGPDWLTNSDQMLDVVRGFVDQVLPLEHYCVAGESYGGYLAQGLAARAPDRIEGLFLLCSLVHAEPARRRVPGHVVLEREPGLFERLTPEERAAFEPVGVIQTGATWEKMKRDVLPGLAARDQKFLDRLWEQGYPFADEAALDRAEYEKPVLIIAGRQDGIVGYEDSQDLASRYPRATCAVLDRAGHNAQIEQPELLEALTAEWLLRVEKSWG